MANSSSSSSSGGKQPSHSASAIVGRAPVSGSHDLKIDGHSAIKGIGHGNYITSEQFVIGGRRWRLQYYPDGYSGYHEWIAIYLCLDPADLNAISVQAQISLLDQDGNPVPAYTKAGNSWTFSRQSGLCAITMAKVIFTEPIPESVSVPLSSPDMQRQFGQLLSTGDGADVTFEVGGETFPAHRSVLAARSSVFNAELLGPMKERTDASIRLDGIEAKVFKAMLHFVYTDSLPHIDAGEVMPMAQHLLVVADRYNLAKLKSKCEDTLRGHFNTSTVATILVLAEQHCCGALKDACFEFVAPLGKFKALTASDGFEHLMGSCPHLLKELVANLAT
uniref:BTB domain-containing protein n=1 Tax=Triticum aestivum TaxID=4565 RepID=A0A3B6RPL3_WHEAT